MGRSIKHNLANLMNFSGRDSRPTFWWWFLFLAIIYIVISIAMSAVFLAPVMAEAMQAGMDSSAGEEVALQNMDSMFEATTQLSWAGLLLAAIFTFLLAGSFTRRLHDAGFSGVWAVVTFGIYFASAITSVVMLPAILESARALSADGNPNAFLEAQGEYLWISLLGYVPIILVIVFGVWPPTEGPNKYGEATTAH